MKLRCRQLGCIVVAVVLAASFSQASAAERLRALVLSGQNNHNWSKTTPVIEEILEQSRRFQVDVTERPDELTAEKLAKYDVIVTNWNNWGPKATFKTWPEPTRAAYLDFVRRGKGHVVVHAGSSSFYDWPEYQRLCLAAWGLGKTGHGPRHEFEVRIDADEHPITAGMKPFRTFDELWHRTAIDPQAKVLASAFSSKQQKGTDEWEPIALAAPFREGRAFTLLLGHDAEAMRQPGFAELLKRGTLWAATGEVTIAK